MSETYAERGLQVAANLATVFSCLRGLAYASVVIAVPVVGCKALPLLDRTVVILENMDDRVERMYEALAPLGYETVDKGVKTVKSVDSKKLGSELQDAITRKLRGEKEAEK